MSRAGIMWGPLKAAPGRVKSKIKLSGYSLGLHSDNNNYCVDASIQPAVYERPSFYIFTLKSIFQRVGYWRQVLMPGRVRHLDSQSDFKFPIDAPLYLI